MLLGTERCTGMKNIVPQFMVTYEIHSMKQIPNSSLNLSLGIF